MRLKKRKVIKPEKAMEKWKEKLDLDIDTKEILLAHTNNHYCTINAKIRSFNCNFLNRNIPYNRRLLKMRKKDSSMCINCGVEETLEHLYWECPKRRIIWEKIKEIYEFYNGSPLMIDKKKCLLGISDNDLETKNQATQQRILFLLGKHFIHINKCDNDNMPSELGWTRYLKRYLKMELKSSEARGTQNYFRRVWEGESTKDHNQMKCRRNID
jgi:hypothetical protein